MIINGLNDRIKAIKLATVTLKTGGVLAFPTETVYGIGVDLFNDTAVQKIYSIKQRDFSKPLTAHLFSLSQVEDLAIEIPDEFYLLAEKFLPGPLTIILKKSKMVSEKVTSGLDTIGIRIPDNDFFQEIAQTFNRPIAATSANLSDMNDLCDASDVNTILGEDVSLIVDGGITKYKEPSTVIQLATKPYSVLREGIIKTQQLSHCLNSEIINLSKTNIF